MIPNFAGFFLIMTMFMMLMCPLQAAPIESIPIEGMSLKNCYKHATLTFYWIPKEGDADMMNDGRTVTLDGPRTKDLVDANGQTIAKVAEITYDKFQMEGTGLLENGVLVNLGGSKNKFQKVNRTSDPFGVGSNENPLTPWVSVASNDLQRGTLLYVKELDGIQLPYGQVHNGCVRVDDEGWSFGKCQIDFFTLQFSAYKDLDNKIPETVTVSQQDCQVQDYVTDQVKNWAGLQK